MSKFYLVWDLDDGGNGDLECAAYEVALIYGSYQEAQRITPR